MRIKPPVNDSDIPDQYSPSALSQITLAEMADDTAREGEVIGTALSEFYRTRQPGWLIALAKVMENRKYFSELIDLHKQYLGYFPADSKQLSTWNEIFDRSTNNMLKIEIDPHLRLRELNVYCKNLTNLEIGQVWIKIQVKSRTGDEKSFLAPLLPHGRLYGEQEKNVTIKAPEHISLSESSSIEYRIPRIEFAR
jgi:hypothetical protein